MMDQEKYFVQIFEQKLNENEIGRSIKTIELIEDQMMFVFLIRGLSVHPITNEGKSFIYSIDSMLLDEDFLETKVFETCFDLEWAWRRPGHNWLDRKRM